jgi:hypothetical protein
LDADSDRLKMQAPLPVARKLGDTSLIAFPSLDFTDFNLNGDTCKTLKCSVEAALSNHSLTTFS